MAPNPTKINRQAVVIIHGMGEQRPNTTLRGFVRCLVAQIEKDTGTAPQFFEKPDKVSGTYETRSKVILKDAAVGRPTTYIYEFYWAHHMRDTKWKHVEGWLCRLLLTRYNKVPARLRKVFRNIWGILVILLLITAAIATFAPLHHLVATLLGVGWLIALIKMGLDFAQSAVLNTLGDAARYMTDDPDNIGQRQKIRKEGIELLRHLHDAKDDLGEPLFDRIVVASHSLGTVVAYDLLRLMWVEYSETYDNSIVPFPNTALVQLEAAGKDLPSNFRGLQHDCWKGQRRAGNRWIVTDFITMGSPLTYFDYLIVGNEDEFMRRVTGREYPTCPPEPDLKYGYHWPTRRPQIADQEPGPIDLLSYSSLFACIRWTNLYFSTDFIGGPLQSILGSGIMDVEIPVNPNPRKFIYPYGHTDYWNTESGKLNAIKQIADALQL